MLLTKKFTRSILTERAQSNNIILDNKASYAWLLQY